MDKLLSIKEVSDILHVSKNSLRSWDGNGRLVPIRTKGGHRRYRESDVKTVVGIEDEGRKDTNRCCIYARVSSSEHKKKGDLERQVGRLSSEALRRGYSIVSVLDEVGSGMNDKRPKLLKIMDMAITREIDIVFIEHKDRLTRFSFNYLYKFFELHKVKIVWTDEVLGKSYEQELVEDILSLMTSFSAKIYGKRSSKNRNKQK